MQTAIQHLKYSQEHSIAAKTSEKIFVCTKNLRCLLSWNVSWRLSWKALPSRFYHVFLNGYSFCCLLCFHNNLFPNLCLHEKPKQKLSEESPRQKMGKILYVVFFHLHVLSLGYHKLMSTDFLKETIHLHRFWEICYWLHHFHHPSAQHNFLNIDVAILWCSINWGKKY